jgi:GDP-4-dehydro-6-deoxy-D-mannose reductase
VPTAEESPVAPISPYAASKAAAELASLSSGLDVVVARPFQHEGPGRDDRFAVGSWTKQIAALEARGGGTIRVGDLTARRDITDVRDVCRAYQLMLDGAVPAGVYNVASGRAVEMRELLELLIAQARCDIEVEVDPALVRPADRTAVCGDASKLVAVTGWTPTVPLEQTLADTLDGARQALAERVPSR